MRLPSHAGDFRMIVDEIIYADERAPMRRYFDFDATRRILFCNATSRAHALTRHDALMSPTPEMLTGLIACR